MKTIISWIAKSLCESLIDDSKPVKILLTDDQTFNGNELWFNTPKGEYLELCAMTSSTDEGHVIIVRKIIGAKE